MRGFHLAREKTVVFNASVERLRGGMECPNTHFGVLFRCWRLGFVRPLNASHIPFFFNNPRGLKERNVGIKRLRNDKR
jgi:hypothetical protein